MAARQTLTLVDGGYPEAFARQFNALRKVVEYCRQQSALASWSSLSPHALEFERPVFTKVNRKDPHLALTNVEDPFGLAGRIADRWAVKDKLLLGIKTNGCNKVELAHANAIRPGDFLEVTFVFDISRQGNQQPKFNIRLWMTRVVRLCARDKLPKIERAPTTNVVMETMEDDLEWGTDKKGSRG
ncbi:hypothetical protein QCA50_010772 [Cerrena zonata]|uniref:Uncharacterized protein n=1 Tax=Cerrena zonata TaxID=2478898 RepID=A0AAW0G843_9APHY